MGNLHNGIHTYGIWEYVVFLDDLFYNAWITAGQTGSLGLTFGLIVSTLATRLFFVPSTLYSQIVGHKMKLLQPDNDEMTAAYKRYTQQGNQDAAKIERLKMKNLRKQHGIYPMISMFNIL